MSGPLGVVVTVVLFIIVLGSLVLVHELGHFLTARLAGVRVLEFGIGFPPRAKVLRSRGETLYTLNWLPIGGFVKLEGEDGDDSGDPRSFVRASLPVKLIILVAGVLMNLLVAFLIFTVIAWLATPYVGLHYATVQPGSPAAAAGLQPNESILAINGQQDEFFGSSNLHASLQSLAGQTVTLTVQRANGDVVPVTVTLRSADQIDDQHGALGIGDLKTMFFGSYSRDLPSAIQVGANETVHWFGVILAGLGDLVGQVVSNPTAPPPVAGPVGIATQISDVFFLGGPILTLYVAGILSANLALVNSLPFPPLDGGRMLMIVLKAIFGSRISVRAERLTYLVGFAFLFTFLIWVTVFDVFGRTPS